jgi:hypothetical protein
MIAVTVGSRQRAVGCSEQKAKGRREDFPFFIYQLSFGIQNKANTFLKE